MVLKKDGDSSLDCSIIVIREVGEEGIRTLGIGRGAWYLMGTGDSKQPGKGKA